jgi:hypothetical protein
MFPHLPSESDMLVEGAGGLEIDGESVNDNPECRDHFSPFIHKSLRFPNVAAKLLRPVRPLRISMSGLYPRARLSRWRRYVVFSSQQVFMVGS